MTRDVGFLVLAAGRSQRFGSNKLAAELPTGETILAASLQTLMAVSRNVAVVSSIDGDFVRETAHRFGAMNVEMPGVSPGMGDSIAFGVRQTHHWRGWVICLADMPFIGTSVFQNLLNEVDHSSLARPVYEGKPGHPVYFSEKFFGPLCALTGDSGAREIIQSHVTELTRITVNDAGVLRDVDRVQDLV